MASQHWECGGERETSVQQSTISQTRSGSGRRTDRVLLVILRNVSPVLSNLVWLNAERRQQQIIEHLDEELAVTLLLLRMAEDRTTKRLHRTGPRKRGPNFGHSLPVFCFPANGR